MLNEGCRRVQKGRTNRKREEWQVNAKSGHESDQRGAIHWCTKTQTLFKEHFCETNKLLA